MTARTTNRRTDLLGWWGLALLLALGIGCEDTTPDDNETGQPKCGGQTVEKDDRKYCAFPVDEITETGFSCPSAYPHKYTTEKAVVCATTKGSIPDEHETAIDTRLANNNSNNNNSNNNNSNNNNNNGEWTLPGVDTKKLDLLWVIDNSQSMCQEQRQLRDNFKKFVSKLRENPIDFHIGVTTTQMKEEYAPEKVAVPGELQSTPHPVVGFDNACRYAVDETGQLIDNDHSDPNAPSYDPVRWQIKQAVECTKDPGKYSDLTSRTKAEIECALYGNSAQASIKDPCQQAGEDPSEFTAADLFPCGHETGEICDKQQLEQVYRDVPKVIKASDSRYQKSDGTLDFAKLEQDFACMSYVGTRGHSQEQGLLAAATALSKEKTGGPVSNPYSGGTSAPNHGLLRKDARLGVIFVTDENDCSQSDQGDVDDYGCGEMNCYYAAKPGENTLMSTSELARKLESNVKESKRKQSLGTGEIFVASIHGKSQPYTGDIKKMCSANELRAMTEKLTVCSGAKGQARSGDRYEAFLGEFDSSFPKPATGGGSTKGYMCEASLGPALESIATAAQQ